MTALLNSATNESIFGHPEDDNQAASFFTPAGNAIKPGQHYLLSDLQGNHENALVQVLQIDIENGTLNCAVNNSKSLVVMPDELEGPVASPHQILIDARDMFASDGELEIDDNATVRVLDDSTCEVSCWVWVPDEATDIESHDAITEDDRKASYLCGVMNIDTPAEFRDDITVSLGDDAGSYVSGWLNFGIPTITEAQIDAGNFFSKTPSATATLTTLNVPEFFRNGDFIAWLNDKDTNSFTWHQKGYPASEWSDVIVLVDGSCNGEGDSSEMPETLWNLLVGYCEKNFGARSGDHYYLKLCNM